MTSGNTGFALGKRGKYPLKLKGSVNWEIRKYDKRKHRIRIRQARKISSEIERKRKLGNPETGHFYEAIINKKAF